MMNYVSTRTLDEKTTEWLDEIEPFIFNRWELNPDKSALLIIDCQNFFVSGPEPDGAPILPRIKELAGTFRDAGRPVIFTRHMHKADGSDFGMIGKWWSENIIENTPESEIHPALEVEPSDIIIRKNRYSAFHDTDLDEHLKKLAVEDLVITGVMTNLCCETTARVGFMKDYRIFLPADANGTSSEEMHVASLLNIAFGFGTVVRSSDVISAFG
jgi:nicotinamidase-related amidase